MWERNKKLTFTAITETIQSVYRGDKRYELSDHLGNVHVVVSDRKQLHCGLEDNVPFPEYYTAEVKNRYDYYPFGMLMEERKYAAPDCRYDIDTSFIATVIDQNFEEDPTLDAWLYIISSATPNYGSGSMLLDYDQDPLITYWPADEGNRYKVTFSFSFEGDCDSLQVLGNVQNSTTQSYTSGGTYTFDFMVNDVSGGYGVFGFYKDNPDCIVYIHSVKIEQYTTSTQVVCDTDSVAGYRFGFNGQMKDDEVYGPEGTAYSFEYRIHDARLGRFLSVDPLARWFPWNSPYSFAENDVVRCIDFEGKEKLEVNGNKIKIQLTYFVYTEGEGAFTNVSTARDIANQIATNSSRTYEVLEDVSLVATDGMSFVIPKGSYEAEFSKHVKEFKTKSEMYEGNDTEASDASGFISFDARTHVGKLFSIPQNDPTELAATYTFSYKDVETGNFIIRPKETLILVPSSKFSNVPISGNYEQYNTYLHEFLIHDLGGDHANGDYSGGAGQNAKTATQNKLTDEEFTKILQNYTKFGTIEKKNN